MKVYEAERSEPYEAPTSYGLFFKKEDAMKALEEVKKRDLGDHYEDYRESTSFYEPSEYYTYSIIERIVK